MSTNSNQTNEGPDEALISYQQLRMFIGVLGLFLSLMLFVTTFLLNDESPFKVSISHYYYSFGHIIFVGTLCIMGGLFGTYRGKRKYENMISNLCGILAVLVAVFPTKFEGYGGSVYIHIDHYIGWFSYVHYASAGLLFALFSVYCFAFFPKTDDKPETPEEILKKKRRDIYYRICGWGIIVSVLCIGVIAILNISEDVVVSSVFLTYSTLIFETTSLFFFSTSWLLKSSSTWKIKVPFFR
jgi:magnesium-transporting ATPase (P-type)